MEINTVHSQPGEPGPDSVEELALPAEKTAPGTARAFVRDRWPDLDEEVLDDITLIVSELVSNAVLHGQPEILLRILVEPFAIDVSVLDHGPNVPSKTRSLPAEGAMSGRGLTIVERLASDWGVVPLTETVGKTVWARLQHGDDPQADKGQRPPLLR